MLQVHEPTSHYGDPHRDPPLPPAEAERGPNDITRDVISAAIEVHRHTGPGLLETLYETFLCEELRLRNVPFSRQVLVPMRYKGRPCPNSLRLDLLVENRVVVEIKATRRVEPVHLAQVLTYLRLCHLHVGLLLNFNVPLMKDGIRRIAHRLGSTS